MSAAVPPPPSSEPRRLARAAWPLVVVVPVAAWALYPAASYDGTTSIQTASQIAAVVVAVLWCGYTVGGRAGIAVGFVLGGLAAYCAWWLSLGIDDNLSRYSWSYAAEGLNEWVSYLAGLVFNLWPLLLVAGAVTRRAALKRGSNVWHALGLVALALTMLATPYRSAWSDGCNFHGGAAPALLTPVTSMLMDIGVGVMPNASSTQMACVTLNADGSSDSVGDQAWRPFWQSSDGLPVRLR